MTTRVLMRKYEAPPAPVLGLDHLLLQLSDVIGADYRCLNQVVSFVPTIDVSAKLSQWCRLLKSQPICTPGRRKTASQPLNQPLSQPSSRPGCLSDCPALPAAAFDSPFTTPGHDCDIDQPDCDIGQSDSCDGKKMETDPRQPRLEKDSFAKAVSQCLRRVQAHWAAKVAHE